MGVRQGSVEGEECLSALYQEIGQPSQPRISTEVNVSDLKFMDDLVSFFEFHDLDTLQRFIECVTAVFTQHSFQVNVGKLEVCAVVARPRDPGSSDTVETGAVAHSPQRCSRTPS